ncbi:MAG: hypothetical protein H6636_03045 [Anaerolineales bacterium]|nr:hypothetical protein [Anaerolineales bacterium]
MTLKPLRTVAFVFLLALTACSTSNPTRTMTEAPLPTSTEPAPISTGPAVEVWLTLGDQSKKLSHEADVTFQPGAGSENAIRIDSSILYQQMEGFGAAMTDSSAWLLMKVLPDAKRQEVMNNLFTRAGDGIGISYVRIPMGASDFAHRDYSYDDRPKGETDPKLAHFSVNYDEAYIIPSLQQALSLNPELRFMGSPWSAPAWMKVNEQFHGTELLPEFYQAFADYHIRFVQAYAEHGLPIDALTPQNEPMYATSNYPTMSMSAAAQQTFVRDYLGPALKQAGLTTRILILDHNWDLWEYPMEILSDSAAAAFVDGVAFHCYGGDVKNQSIVHDAFPEKGIWFTECSGGEWATDFGGNMSWNMHNLVLGNFRNWGKGVILWNLALDENFGPQNGGCGDCRGVVKINQSTGQVTYNEEYYILGHVSKFVDPGAYRTESTYDPATQPDNIAFLNPDGSLVLIVQADRAGTFDVEWNGQHFSYTAPANATLTFKWHAGVSLAPTATPAAAMTPTPLPTPVILDDPGQPPASDLLLDFERLDGTFSSYNADALSGNLAHSGAASLLNASVSGEWHTIGATFSPMPLDLTAYQKLCFWVYDTTDSGSGAADNTVAIKLTDGLGNDEEHWTDHVGVGINPKTIQNEWVQMCFNLSAFTEVDLSRLLQLEFTTYWAGETYFDEVTVEK